jgi:hypothetical protein
MVVLLVKKIRFGIIRLVNGIMLQLRLIRKKFKNVVHVPKKTRKYQNRQPKIYIAHPNLDN